MNSQNPGTPSIAGRGATSREFFAVIFRRKWLILGLLFVTTATVPLALGIPGDIYVTIEHISKSPTVAAVTAALVLVVLVGLWHVYPLTLRYLRTARARSHRSRPAH